MILDFLKFFAQLFGLLSYQPTEPTTPNIYCTTTDLTPFFQQQDINSDVVLLINDDICFTGIDNGDWIKVSVEVNALKSSLVWNGEEAHFNPEASGYTHVGCADSCVQQCMDFRNKFDYFWTRNQTDANRTIHKRQFGNLGKATWSEWSEWSECSGKCNELGVRVRERKCLFLNKIPSTACSGTNTGSESCNSDCIDSTWTSWAEWDACPKPCNGTTRRRRDCKMDKCTGSDFEEKICTQDLCSVDGGWTDWGEWNECSHIVGTSDGMNIRYRECDNPKTLNGGKNCDGSAFEFKKCFVVWEDWGEWSPCFGAENCKVGTRFRLRKCHANSTCHGEDYEREQCFNKTCDIAGSWSDWQSWGVCSCNGNSSTRYRQRACDHPAPQNNGNDCEGKAAQSESCARERNDNCPVNGNWSLWTEWSECSATCGNHTYRTRSHTCTNPSPKNGGDNCSGSSEEKLICPYVLCPVAGGWTNWTEWTQCSVTCGGQGTQSMNRSCDNPAPLFGGAMCKGDGYAMRNCTSQDICPIDGGYSEWNEWGHCTVTCDGGYRIRNRKCDSPIPSAGGQDCNQLGSPTDTGVCGVDSCPVDGHWSLWGNWTECSVSCGNGQRSRNRTCTEPAPAFGGDNCTIGSLVTSENCSNVVCPVDGGWGAWESWSVCDCNNEQNRKRTCDSPPPVGAGKQCEGNYTQTINCIPDALALCPKQGGWTNWFPWIACSATCGHGTRLRLRICENPKPENGGRYCEGEARESTDCFDKNCAVDGNWAEWERWGACDKPCDTGHQSRNRTCSNPEPAYGGQNCSGEGVDTTTCNTQHCPVNGVWGEWGHWAKCDVTCALGNQMRNRSCDNPPPAFGGQECAGEETEFQKCQKGPCPIDGKWSGWGVWSECSVTCLNGTKSRNRTCDNPPAQYNGTDCVGSYTNFDVCRPRDNCDVNGGWSEWSGYTPCDSTCGTGTKMAFRTCDNPPPQHNGMYCQGEFSTSSSCIVKPCPVDGAWNSWMEWGACSTTCQTGFRIRSRLCDKPANAHGGKPCPGSFNDNITCFERECPVDGGMSDWSEWSTCSLSCGNGTQTRNRTCTNPTPMYGGANCTEDSSEDQLCLVVNCPINGIWSDWAAWGACDVTCGNGTMTRSRSCDNPQPDFGGEVCVGNETDVTECPDKCCPVDGNWALWYPWSACQGDCSKGTRSRFRNCDNPHQACGGNQCDGVYRQTDPCLPIDCTTTTSAEPGSTSTPSASGAPTSSLASPSSGTDSAASTVASTAISSATGGLTDTTIVAATTKTSTTTVATTTASAGISCTVCNNVPPLCFQLHHVASCPEPYCINEVTNTADGSKTISRRCGTLRECNSDWWHTTSDDPDCQTYNPNGNVNKYVHCTFCCTTENCNADVVPKPGTLYTPPDDEVVDVK